MSAALTFQDQAMPHDEQIETYTKRGGVVHLFNEHVDRALCGQSVGAAATDKKLVNCLPCIARLKRQNKE